MLKRRSEREWEMTLSDAGDVDTGKGILLVLLDSASPHSQIDRVVSGGPLPGAARPRVLGELVLSLRGMLSGANAFEISYSRR